MFMVDIDIIELLVGVSLLHWSLFCSLTFRPRDEVNPVIISSVEHGSILHMIEYRIA